MSLTPELSDLMEHEKVIEQGLGTFIEVGNALLAIREGRKYRASGYDTFEDYCRQRWELSRSRAYQMIDAAEMSTIVDRGIQPRSEGQLRPLTKLRDEPEAAREAWSEAVGEAEGGQPTAKQVEKAVIKRVSKPKLNDDGVSHPARFGDELVKTFYEILERQPLPGMQLYSDWFRGDVETNTPEPPWVLDPFAGTGKIHELYPEYNTFGIELEPEWANLHERTQQGNALNLPFEDHTFDAVVTSPCYGNRLADSHNASDPELRRSYTHDLGRPLHDENAGSLHWRDGVMGSERYRIFHGRAWAEAYRVLRPGGVFVLSIKDHWRDGRLMPVSAWHAWHLGWLGLTYIDSLSIDTGNLRQGANNDKRQPEMILVYRKYGMPDLEESE